MDLAKWINRLYMLIFAVSAASIFTSIVAARVDTAATSAISSSLCTIVVTVQTVVGVIALVMFILGGALYAVAHMLPAAGNLKSSAQGWSLGMIVGGVVGIVIVIAAPGIIGLITTAGSSGITPITCT